MRYDLDKGAHSVYSLQYHFIQCVKYRRDIFSDDRICDLLKTKLREISITFEVDILNIECDVDHFHMIFKSKPTLNIPKYINSFKTISSREIRRNFPKVKEVLWNDAFWSRSYFIATTGQVTLDALKQYVDNQEVKRHAHCDKD